jgi:Pyruvate/2-oxoglutarate dehydrogenase complex, dihydrolipoamide dehydrogenase (E3) component, and related enzymes
LNSSEKFAEISKHAAEHGISTGKVSLDLAKLMQRKNKIVKQLTSGIGFLFKKNKITHIQGGASFWENKTIKVSSSDGEKNYSAKNYIIATGSTSIAIDAILIDEKQIVTSTGALALESVLKSFLVIGGGYKGIEMGFVWNRIGSKVTVVEAFDRIVLTMDEEIATEFMKSFKKQGKEFKLSYKVLFIIVSKSGVEVSMESLEKKQITEKYEVVLMSVGRK